MWLPDAFAFYLHGLKALAVVLALMLLISGLDDFFIDAAYWTRRMWRFLTVYDSHARFNGRVLHKLAEKPLALLVPAWQAQGVIGTMVERTVTTLDYENYHIFIATYLDDAQTRCEVAQAQARFPNVHQVLCAQAGPASKADGLNAIVEAIFQFEQRAGLKFEGFILHGLQDRLSPSALRVFNFLVDRKDLIQLPLHPLPRPWHAFTGGHCLDEMAEMYGKDLVVREALAGQVPGAGAGCCLSRRAVMLLRQEGGGMAFDLESASQGYSIGLRLKAHGLSEVLIRIAEPAADRLALRQAGRSLPQAGMVAVQAWVPQAFSAAVGEKSRRIAGVYQGFRTHGWRGSLAMKYFLWRDRKGLITHGAGLLAMLLALQLALVWAGSAWLPGGERFLSGLAGDAWFTGLLLVNAGLMANRVLQRLISVTAGYGVVQGLLSVPRMLWGTAINFMAHWRAVRQVLAGDLRCTAGNKREERDKGNQACAQFPRLGGSGQERQALGQILLAQHAILEVQLAAALRAPVRGLRLGSQLVHQGLITTDQLAMALATQGQVGWEAVDALALSSFVLAKMPASMALHYAVLPLREEGCMLVLASESNLDPVSLAAMARRLARPVRYVIAPKGQVVVGLRHWYARQRTLSARALLDKVIATGCLTPAEAEPLWREYVSLQLLMGEVLQSLGRMDAPALSAVLLRQERSGSSLGRFLLKEGVIGKAALDEVLQLQQQHQGSMLTLLERAGKQPFFSQVAFPKEYVA
jgi:adsorption protein B